MKPEDITDEMRNRAAREYKRQLARDGNCIDFGEILVAALTEEIEVSDAVALAGLKAYGVRGAHLESVGLLRDMKDAFRAMESVRRRGEKMPTDRTDAAKGHWRKTDRSLGPGCVWPHSRHDD